MQIFSLLPQYTYICNMKVPECTSCIPCTIIRNLRDAFTVSLFYFINDPMKTATTINEQIQLLHDRGMKFINIEKAKEILLDIGYYRLGFYWFPYEQTYPSKNNRNHQFKDNTLFENAVTLYYFDHDLRSIIAPYLYRIEINFRTFLIYIVSNRYKKNPTWFADSRIVSNDFVTYLPDCYKTICKNEAIKRHHRKYINDIYAPAWKTLEYMTFGDTLYLYSCLKDKELKEKISAHYNIKNTNVFENYMNTLRVIRNLCAHGHNIYDLKLQKRIRKGPIAELEEHRLHDLSGGLLVLTYILNAISTNKVQDLHYKLNRLISQPQIENINDIIHDLKHFITEHPN